MDTDIEIVIPKIPGHKYYRHADIEYVNQIGINSAYWPSGLLSRISSYKYGQAHGKHYVFMNNNSLLYYAGNIKNNKRCGYSIRPQPENGRKIIEK
jgi:antitoxin component YwqK of YwqJK toxin-antitoxin module